MRNKCSFTAAEIWKAIDGLAEKKGMSLSALAEFLGYHKTSLTPARRYLSGRCRWPSIEILSTILKKSDLSFYDFLDLGYGRKKAKISDRGQHRK